MTFDQVISLSQVGGLLFFAGAVTQSVREQGRRIGALERWREKTDTELLPMQAEHRVFHHSEIS